MEDIPQETFPIKKFVIFETILFIFKFEILLALFTNILNFNFLYFKKILYH